VRTIDTSDLRALAKCSKNPLEYFKYFSTLHPTDGVKSFPDFPYFPPLVDHLISNRQSLIVKSRQMFATWLTLTLLLWKATFKGAGVYLILSKNEKSAKELIQRLQFLIENCTLPRLETGKFTTEEIEFKNQGSRIISLPATPEAPRMHSPAGVLWDELAFTPYQREIWTALKPALDSGGSFWGVSTSSGPTGLFADMAKNPESFNIKCFYLHYSANPAKDKEWEKQARRGLSDHAWRREYEISFDKSANAVYSEFNIDKNTFLNKTFGEKFKIYHAIDWGFFHPVCLWIAEDFSENIYVFDELIGDKLTLLEFQKDILRKDKENNLDLSDIVFTACDPAGQSPGETGISPIARFQKLGMRMKFCSSKISEGIDLIKMFLGPESKSKLLVKKSCTKLIEDFLGYEYEAEIEEPMKDNIHDHTLDALRYFFVNRFRIIKIKPLVGARVRGIQVK
jgi:hypothetical protein